MRRDNASLRHLLALSLALTGLLLSACATQVEVDGNFPPALTQQLPLRTTVVFEPDFSTYRFQSTEGFKLNCLPASPIVYFNTAQRLPVCQLSLKPI